MAKPTAGQLEVLSRIADMMAGGQLRTLNRTDLKQCEDEYWVEMVGGTPSLTDDGRAILAANSK